MKLEAEGDRAVLNPQTSQIQYAVHSMALPDRSFVILSRTGTSFLQAAMTGSDALLLECREIGTQQPASSKRTNFSRDEVARILEAYAQGGDAWREGIEWAPVGAPDTWGRASSFFMVAALVVMVAGVLSRGDERFALLSIAYMVFLPSQIIDLRRFRTMTAYWKVRTIGALIVGVLIALLWIDRWVSKRG
jgi:hypothetical protein